jgi:dihydroorotate dehydrogenase electron transfer subunit
MKPEALSILSNRKITEGHYILRCKNLPPMAKAKPGQFVQILTDDDHDPFLPRPFSFLDVTPKYFEILYQVVGRGTEILAKKRAGDALTILGPLGCGWKTNVYKRARGKILLVGGGVGIPPLYHFAKNYIALHGKKSAKDIHAFIGGRDKSLLHCRNEFKKLGVPVVVSTDNGSAGHKGLITEPLDGTLRESAAGIEILTCGPTPMLKAVSALAEKYNAACQVSVEEPMPCGFGACLGCAIKIKDDAHDEGFRYAMSCTEGPVFNAREVLWE